ncbi:hypothetical protein BN871_KF_00050 [Paenibacillus sp. P22]|nr:hypothetical protein BN871_KF_00050 [Paenibacillus sp. P22]
MIKTIMPYYIREQTQLQPGLALPPLTRARLGTSVRGRDCFRLAFSCVF